MSNYPKVERKLASIMFTDIAGFTETMSVNEEHAYHLIDKKRQLLIPLISENSGELVKEIGDGTLSLFKDSSDSINCARDFQYKSSNIPNLNVRAGIHYGEIIKEEQDVFGDVVNIASRLETLAKPGSVFVSREAIDQIKSDTNYKFVSLGLQALKGVGRLIEVFALDDPEIKVPSINDYQDTSIHVHSDEEVASIAIIPFENKGAEEDIFYSYGISSDLISDISTAGVIRVASMKNIENIKNYNDLKLEEYAAKLFVRYITTGTLWKMGDLFQLSIELYDTKSSQIIWSDRWQEKWENLITIKSKLTDGLLKSLATEQKVDLKPETLNSEAYEFYLKGKYRYEKRQSKEDNDISRQLLEKALNIDENLISARITLGNTYNESGNYSKAFDLYSQSREYAEQIDDKLSLASALNNIGNLHMLKGEYEETEEIYKSSLDIRNSICDKLGIASSLNNLGNLYRRKGEYKYALDNYKKSLSIFEELEDQEGIATALNNVGVMQRLNNNYDNSLKSYKKAFTIRKDLEDQNGMALLLNNIGNVYFMQNNLNQALNNYRRSLDIVRKTGNKLVIANSLNNKANIYFTMANYEKALRIYFESLELRKNLSDKNGIASSFINIGIIYYILGQFDRAIECFHQSRDLREELNDKNGLINSLKSIAKTCLRTMKYDLVLKNLEKVYLIQRELGQSISNLAETKIRILLASKKIGKDILDDDIDKSINGIIDPDHELYYDIYLLTEDSIYLQKSYDLLKSQAEKLNDELKKKYISYFLNKNIFDEYKKKTNSFLF